MALKVYNTLSRKKETFVPKNPGRVGIYSCGPTVYDFFHIGNARAFLVPDMIRRYLEGKGYAVTQVLNFTDIDDKIIHRAQEMGISTPELAHQFIQAYFQDIGALNIKEADYYPRATDHLPEIISLIEVLQQKGFVYQSQGDLFFHARKLEDYGALSGQDLSALREGVRIAANERKQDPLDFVLWKKARDGEPFWESPFGPGRPGWHSECCVMSRKYLGDAFDIHTGGSDLIFPHHENERAQSQAAYGGTFVRYWIHNGYINIEGEKMSKSLGNFFTTRDILKEFHGGVLRYFLLSKHYRSPINFSREELQSAQQGLKRIQNLVRSLGDELHRLRLGGGEVDLDLTNEQERLIQEQEAFFEAMDDDFNSAKALGHLQSLIREGNQIMAQGLPPRPRHYALVKAYLSTIQQLAEVLGFQLERGEEKKVDHLSSMVDFLLQLRKEARQEKDYQRADSIRNTLLDWNIVVEDGREGSRWYFQD